MTTILVKRGATASVAAATPAAGELVLDTTTGQLYAGDGATAGGRQVSRRVSTRHIEGFEMVWGSSSISVQPGCAYIPSTGLMVESSAAITVTLSGMTSGTFYHLYAYRNGAAAAIELSATAPVAAATGGYTKTGDTTRRYIGSVLASGAASVYSFVQQGNTILYTYGTLASAPFGFSGSATTATSVDVSTCVPVTGVSARGMLLNSSTTAGTTLRIGNAAMGTVSSTLQLQLALIGSAFMTEIPLSGVAFTYIFDATPSTVFNFRCGGYTFNR